MTRFLSLNVRIALKSAHGGDAELRVQIRVFAVGFLDAAPARVARHIHDRVSACARRAAAFLGGHREEFFHQFGIERRAEADGLRENSSRRWPRGRADIPRETSPECRAGCLDEKFLDGVGQFRRLPAFLPTPLAGVLPASLGRPTWPMP